MNDQNSRPARQVGIADHLWDTYEDMARQMGSDRDALINQALFMFARLNGFIEVARTGRSEVAAASGAGVSAQASRGGAPAGGGNKFAPTAPQPVLVPQRPGSNSLEHEPARREVAERVRETAAELERLIKGKSNEPGEGLDEEPLPEDSDADMRLAPEDEPLPRDEPLLEDEPLPEDEPMDEPAGVVLILSLDNAEPQAITKDRFVIGRGKHCDLVINSGKVSREHAVIIREGDTFFIEDLGSSNGTWFNKQRIKRRSVEDGDEYFICNERVQLSFQ